MTALRFSDRDEENRRLGRDPRERDEEFFAELDRLSDTCPADEGPVRCAECGGRGGYGSINACLGCAGRGWV